jgi:dihydrodiol dehydrogenase / D-xylose 1-dehydrogenase (NADP)
MSRWGFLGAGHVSREFAHSLRLVPGATLRSVASRTASSAASFAQEFDIPQSFSDYAAMLADDDLDVVYIATPSQFHDEHAVLALEAGKAVLVEKPFATSAAGAQRIVDAARANERFCMEGMWMRFIPAIRALKQLIDAGEIGTPKILTASLGFRIPYSPDSRYYRPELGGGSLLDLGVYPISLAFFLLGHPSEVSCQMTLTETGVDQQASALLKHGDALAQLSCGFVDRLDNGAGIVGTEGAIRIAPPVYAPTRLLLEQSSPVSQPSGTSPGPKKKLPHAFAVDLRRRLLPVARTLLRPPRRITRNFSGFGYQFEAAEVERCLAARELESPTMPLDESLAILRVVDGLTAQGHAYQ